jgi:hypothetical protein
MPMADITKTTFGFMNLQTGKFLRVSINDEPFDGQESHAWAWFSSDPEDDIWETDDAAVIIDILHPWAIPYLSEDALSGGLPEFGHWFTRENLNAMAPVAFQRVMRPVVEGGDAIPVSMSVSGIHFEIARDPDSVWLVSLETSEAVKLNA